MSKIQMFTLSLAAVLVGPVYAQVCSGGNDGGMDATGNQCNTLNEVAAFAAGSAITPPRHKSPKWAAFRPRQRSLRFAWRRHRTKIRRRLPWQRRQARSFTLRHGRACLRRLRPDRKRSARAAPVPEWMSTAISAERLRRRRKSAVAQPRCPLGRKAGALLAGAERPSSRRCQSGSLGMRVACNVKAR